MSQTMPWYPLYHEAFELDTQTWTVDEIGSLVRLMNYQWANGSVPDNQPKLARICRVDMADWPEIWQTLEPKFEQVASAPGHLINRRLAIEHERQTRKRKQATDAANKRWRKDSIISNPDTDASHPHVPDGCDLELELDLDADKREASPPLPGGLNLKAWGRWLHYRRETNKAKWKPVTIKAQTKKLVQLTEEQQARCVEHSIENGYSGLFPDKFRGGSNEPGLSPTERVERATGIKRL